MPSEAAAATLPEGWEVESYTPRPELIDSIVYHESRGNPTAKSPKGARGLMQIEPDTAKDYGVTNLDDLDKPEVNRRVGTQYFSDLLKRYKGDERQALIAYNQGPNRKGLAPGAAEYADRVLARASTPASAPVSNVPAGSEGPSLPEGFEVETLPSGQPAPNPLAESQAGRETTAAAHATAQELARRNVETPRTLLPIAASILAPELLPETVSGAALGGPTVTALTRGAIRAGAFTTGLEAGKAAVGEPVSIGDAARNFAFASAFEAPGAIPPALKQLGEMSPTVQAAIDRVAATTGRVTGATAKAANAVTEFFRSLGANPDELAQARLSTATGKRLGEQAYSVLNDHRSAIQGELKGALGDAANAAVPREVVDSPISQIIERIDETGQRQNLSPKMNSFISRFAPIAAEDGTATAQATKATKYGDLAKNFIDQGNSLDQTKAALQRLGASKADIDAALKAAKPFDYEKSFEDEDFYHKPSYNIDELTAIRSKLHTSVQSGNAYDRQVNDFVSRSLGNDIDKQVAEHGGTSADIQKVHDFFEQKWPELKNMQDAFDLGARGLSGVAQADKLLDVAKTEPYLFERYMQWAQDLQRSQPSSQIMPALREATVLRLSRAADLADSPEAAKDAIGKAIDEIPFRLRREIFGPGSPVTDAKALKQIFGQFKNPAEQKQMAAVAGRAARGGWWFLSRYMTGRILYAVGKDMGLGGRSHSTSPFTATKADLPLLAGSFAAAFFGPTMFRTIMSYAGPPVQRAYVDWLLKPQDQAALSRFGRVLNGAIGGAEGALAGSQTGHPYLGAAIGATLRSIGGIPGVTDGKLLEPDTAPPGMPPAPAPEVPPGSTRLRPTGIGPMGERIQGFKLVGQPKETAGAGGPAPAAEPGAEGDATPRGGTERIASPATPIQLPAVAQDDPMKALRFLKDKAKLPPRIARSIPPQLRNGVARPALPGGFAGPEGEGQFVTRGAPTAGEPATPRPAVEAPAQEPQSGLFATVPTREPNADFRKMKLAPNPQNFTGPASSLERNPTRWQYKESNFEGLTGALSGVKHYDTVQGGDLIAYYDPASQKLEVIDGHQRQHAALNDNDEQVKYYVLDGGHTFNGALAHDVTPEAARSYAALRNLRNGTGTSVDTAKFLRDSGLKPEDLKDLNVPMSGSMMRDGVAMSNLADPVFRDVAMHRFPERLGIVMGTELADRPEVQLELMKDLRAAEAKGEEVSPADLTEWIKMAKGAESKQLSMTDLFGERKQGDTNYREMGQLSKFIIGDFKKDKSAFKYVGKNADRLLRGNTVVDVETGTQLSNDAANRLMMYRRVAYEPDSQTHKILSDAAWKMKGAKTAAQRKIIQRETYESIKQWLHEDFDKAVSAARETSAAAGG